MVVMYGHQLSGNLKALYEEWQRSFTQSFSLHFLSLDPDYSAQLEQEGVNVLRCNRLRDMLALRQATVMVTDHGLHAMRPLVRFTSIKFVDVWHGIPFKGFIPEDFKLQHRYDEVWVSSPLLKKIYQEKFGFRPEIVRDMGYARTDRLFRRELPDPNFRKQAGIPDTGKIVLYAPTWKQDSEGRELFPFNETQDSFLGLLGIVCRRHAATLVVRSHLNANIGQSLSDRVVYCPMSEFPDTGEVLLHSAVLICDWSSIAFDFLALDRPTIFLDVEPPFRNGFSLGKEFRFGKLVADTSDLSDSLDRVLANPMEYAVVHGDAHESTGRDIYGLNRDGLVASRQMSAITRLIAINSQS